jgi:2-methylcitrate dehydratase PrpD
MAEAAGKTSENLAIATRVAEWIVKTRPEEIPTSVMEKARICILDTIGVTIAGAEDNVGKILAAYIQDLGGKPDCAVIGTPLRTAPPLAALANGALGHALDFDDITYVYHAHPSVSVLPAALAAGELMDASGMQLLGAFIIGTEVASKVGAMVNPKLARDGWHSTCVMGAFGAAAAAGKLLGLTVDQLARSFAITASETSGIKGSIGSMCKSFQVGRSSENGVVAALLAKRGLTGAHDIFEKLFGFCHTFKVSNDFDAFYSKMGNPFTIENPGFYPKEFPSCSASHPALRATIRLIRQHNIYPRQVESVNCAATPWVIASLLCPDPHNAVEARFSMQFCLAAALLGRGKVKVADFRDENVRDPRTVDMMKKIALETSPELAAKGIAPPDGPEAAIVDITLRDGRRFNARESFADWRPDNMPCWDMLTRKYRECASPVLPKDKLERSIEQIGQMEKLKTVRDLMASIVP